MLINMITIMTAYNYTIKHGMISKVLVIITNNKKIRKIKIKITKWTEKPYL